MDIEARRDPLVGLTTGDLVEYGFIPEWVFRGGLAFAER